MRPIYGLQIVEYKTTKNSAKEVHNMMHESMFQALARARVSLAAKSYLMTKEGWVREQHEKDIVLLSNKNKKNLFIRMSIVKFRLEDMRQY